MPAACPIGRPGTAISGHLGATAKLVLAAPEHVKPLQFASDDRELFERRSAQLYKKRMGVSYMLPSSSGRIEEFYQQVIANRELPPRLAVPARLSQDLDTYVHTEAIGTCQKW